MEGTTLYPTYTILQNPVNKTQFCNIADQETEAQSSKVFCSRGLM